MLTIRKLANICSAPLLLHHSDCIHIVWSIRRIPIRQRASEAKAHTKKRSVSTVTSSSHQVYLNFISNSWLVDQMNVCPVTERPHRCIRMANKTSYAKRLKHVAIQIHTICFFFSSFLSTLLVINK